MLINDLTIRRVDRVRYIWGVEQVACVASQ